MHYEKAELILQQLLTGDRDYYLVETKEGKPLITDCPRQDQKIVGELQKRKKPNLLCQIATMVICFICTLSVFNLHNSPCISVRKEEISC